MDEASSVYPRLQKLIPKVAKVIFEEVDIQEFEPVGSRMLCRPMEQDVEETDSGLKVVRDAVDKPRLHLVLKCGPGKRQPGGGHQPMPASPGDVLIVDGYVGQPVTYNREDFRLIRAADVMAVLDTSPDNFSAF